MTNDTKTHSLGLGCMGMSGAYGPSPDAEDIAAIHAAIDSGVTLLDTGDFYAMGHNELLIGRAIEGRRDEVELSVKFGAMRSPAGQFIGIDCRPAAVKNFAAYSLQRLGVEVIDIYRPARLDPNVPIEDTIGAIVELIEAGYVKAIGLSEVGADTIRRAHAVHPIRDLQIEYALVTRGPEDTIFPTLRELGIGATLYGVLSRGLLSGKKPRGGSDYRAHLPRFSDDNRRDNQRVVEALEAVARARDVTPSQLATAWAIAKQPGFTALIGARTPAQVKDMIGALHLELDEAAVAEIERLVPSKVAGTRYPEAQMAMLDSER